MPAFVQAGIYVGSVLLVALFAKFLPWVTRSAIEDIVSKHVNAAVNPLHERLSRHLDEEERQLRQIHAHLDKIADNKEADHRRLWTEIDKLRHR